MKLLSKEEIVNLIEEIIEEIEECENKSDEDIERLIEKLQKGVLDPEVSNYIFWSEMTPDEIADKVLEYKPIAL